MMALLLLLLLLLSRTMLTKAARAPTAKVGGRREWTGEVSVPEEANKNQTRIEQVI